MAKNRINYLSLASVISAFAVVMLHTNGVFWKFSTERYWVTANIIESVMYFAVPIFFMVSGATLLDYREKYTTKEYFKKRISKTVGPFLAWSLIGVVYRRINQGAVILPQSLEEVGDILLSMLNVEPVSVYWFFIPLFGVYLCVPLFSAIQKELKLTVFKYLAAATFIFNILIPFVCGELQIHYVKHISVSVSSGYLFFVLVGYILSKEHIEKKWRIVSYILGMIGLSVHILGTYNLSMNAGEVVTYYKGYVNLPAVLHAIAMFILIKEIGQKIKSEQIWKFINWAGKYTFAIYLMHWFVMDAMQRIFSLNIYSIVYRLGAPFIVCAVSILITWVLRKIPLIKKIVP